MPLYDNVPITSPRHFHLFHGMAGYLPDQNDFYWHKKYACQGLAVIKQDWLEHNAECQENGDNDSLVMIHGRVARGRIVIERTGRLTSYVGSVERCEIHEHVKDEIASNPSEYPLSKIQPFTYRRVSA